MKKNLIFMLISCLMITVLVSFTLIEKPTKTKVPAKKEANAIAKKPQFACGADVYNLTASGSSFSWKFNVVADHYNYGGYYQAGGTFSGTVGGGGTPTVTVISVSISSKPGGGRFNVTPICADGTAGTPMNILF